MFCCAAEVLLACMAHAMTTEAEEIMGLLLGDVLVRLSYSLQCVVTALSLHLFPAWESVGMCSILP